MKAHLAEHDLVKELENQDFRVESTKDGYKVFPKSEDLKPVFFHASTLEKSPRAYNNVWTQLRRIGVTEPEEVKKARAEAGKTRRRKADEEEKAAGPYVCEDCGYEAPFKRSRARHQQAQRHGPYKERDIRLPEKKTKPVKHVKQELQAKKLIRSIKSHVAALNSDVDELVQLVEPMEEELHTLRSKLKKVEYYFEKGIDQL